MSTASSPTLPGSDERDELALGEHEIVDLHDGREHPDRMLVERIEGFSHTTVSRLGQLFTLGRYDPERAALDAAIAARAEESRRQRKAAVTPAPLRSLAKKADSKLEALRDQDRGYRHVAEYYQTRIRQESPEPKSTLGRWWKWVAGEGAQVKEYRRKLAMVEGAHKETADKLAADPRERMQREFAVEDRNLRLLIIQRAPQLAPDLPDLLHALAAGNAEPLKTAVRGAVPADEAERIMAAAANLRGEYSNLGWRALGALGTVFTLGFRKDARALAAGSKNERSVQLASFYARQADESHVYSQLSVAGQVRTLPSLPVGTVLTVGGQQMAVEKFQEKKGRRVVRLVQLDDAREIFLLDVTNPDAPVLRRAVGRGREVAMRAYRDARSPLPAFAPVEARAAAAPTPLETMTDGVLTAILSNDLPGAEAALAALDARLVANVLPGDDPSSLQEARAATLAALNYRLLAAARSPVRVFQDRDGLHLRVPSPPPLPVTPDAVVPPTALELRRARLVPTIDSLVTALVLADVSERSAAVTLAIAPLQTLVTNAPSDPDAVEIVALANKLLAERFTSSHLPLRLDLTGRRLTPVLLPEPVPAAPTDAERRTELSPVIDRLVTATEAVDPVAREAAVALAAIPLQTLITVAADDAAVTAIIVLANTMLAERFAGRHLPLTLNLAGRTLQPVFLPELVPVPAGPTEAERRAELTRCVNVLIVALDVRGSAAQELAIQSALLHALQPAVTAAADDTQAAEAVRQMNEILAGAYAPAPVPATLVMGAGRVLSVEFPAALPLSEDDLREQFAGSLEAPLADVRALSEEHQRPENRNSHEWWMANRGRYVAFRTTIAAALRAEAARATDVSYQRELQDFARAIERVIDLDGNFPGGHPAIDLIISQATALQRDLRPASGVS